MVPFCWEARPPSSLPEHGLESRKPHKGLVTLLLRSRSPGVHAEATVFLGPSDILRPNFRAETRPSHCSLLARLLSVPGQQYPSRDLSLIACRGTGSTIARLQNLLLLES